jgi:hypothetical protein
MIDARFRGAVVALDAPPSADELTQITEQYSARYFRGAELDATVSEDLPAGLTQSSYYHLTSLGKSLYAVLTPR